MAATEQTFMKNQRTKMRETQKETSFSSSSKPKTGRRERSPKKGRDAADSEPDPMQLGPRKNLSDSLRGELLLELSGLSRDQQLMIRARAGGKTDFESFESSMVEHTMG